MSRRPQRPDAFRAGILVFDAGRIVEEGPHTTLVRRPNGIYRDLFDHQVQRMAS